MSSRRSFSTEFKHETASLVLDQDCVIRKLKLIGLDPADDGDPLDDDPIGALDAELALMSGLLARLLTALKRQLGGYD